MYNFKNMTDYVNSVISPPIFEEIKSHHLPIYRFILTTLIEMEQLIQKMNPDTFWSIFPLLLCYDSRLVMIQSFYDNDQEIFSDEEVITLIEKDYLSNNKERCGYFLNENEPGSLIFFVR